MSSSAFRPVFAALLASVLGLVLVLPSPAWAKDVKIYVNGVNAMGMKDFQFKAVDVRVDSDGNIWIDAPQYKIQVEKPAGMAQQQAAEAPPATSASTAPVPQGHHWLVTQDAGSIGQDVEVLINGTSVREIRSGQAQLILDIGQFLKPGSNVVTFRPLGTEATGGGALKIHLGLGANDSGTLKMDNPQVTYSRTGPDPAGEKSVEYVVK